MAKKVLFQLGTTKRGAVANVYPLFIHVLVTAFEFGSVITGTHL